MTSAGVFLSSSALNRPSSQTPGFISDTSQMGVCAPSGSDAESDSAFSGERARRS